MISRTLKTILRACQGSGLCKDDIAFDCEISYTTAERGVRKLVKAGYMEFAKRKYPPYPRRGQPAKVYRALIDADAL